MKKLSYLNLVGIEIEEVEGGYEVYTNNGGETEEVVYESKLEVAERLNDIKNFYLDEYKEDGKPQDDPSYAKINELIEEYSK